MAHTDEFEDMSPSDWPADLKSLQHATTSALDAYAELDDIISRMAPNEERGALYTLAGQAWALYRDVQALGLARLAEVERDADKGAE